MKSKDSLFANNSVLCKQQVLRLFTILQKKEKKSHRYEKKTVFYILGDCLSVYHVSQESNKALKYFPISGNSAYLYLVVVNVVLRKQLYPKNSSVLTDGHVR
jgi:hypothetical protein